ncbi:MAG: hydroxyacylglutathione hydrolase [Syntrophales bacterium]|nr:hydroxyacylglutathione hydrolase [Syntrophales bacterium]
MSLHIEQFRYYRDNLAYLIFGKREALAIDGGAWEDILSFCQRWGLKLRYVMNTHDHYDHTEGNEPLLAHSGATYVDHRPLSDGSRLTLEDGEITVYRTPGHTDDSVCFHTDHVLITGDTLFNGTVGNCFSGDLGAFYCSLKRLASLPRETRIYAGHDYVREAMAAARAMEPTNPHRDHFLRVTYDPHHVCSTLADELLINPYLRLSEPAIVSFLASLGLPHTTEEARWHSLMSLD